MWNDHSAFFPLFARNRSQLGQCHLVKGESKKNIVRKLRKGVDKPLWSGAFSVSVFVRQQNKPLLWQWRRCSTALQTNWKCRSVGMAILSCLVSLCGSPDKFTAQLGTEFFCPFLREMTGNGKNNFVLSTFAEGRRKILISKFSPVVISATGKRHGCQPCRHNNSSGGTSL